MHMAMLPGHWATHSARDMPPFAECHPAHLLILLQSAELWEHLSEEGTLALLCPALPFEHPQFSGVLAVDAVTFSEPSGAKVGRRENTRGYRPTQNSLWLPGDAYSVLLP